MSLYTDLGDVSTELIAEFGQDVTTKRIESESFDPVTSEVVNTYSTTTRKGILAQVDKRFIDSTSAGTVGSGAVLITDQMIVFGSDGETLANDEITVGGIKYSIVRIIPINPGGVTLAWKVVVRR